MYRTVAQKSFNCCLLTQCETHSSEQVPRRHDFEESTDGRQYGGAGPRRRQCCACHRCRRGLITCLSREACAHTTHVLLTLVRGDAEPLGCKCLDSCRRDLPTRLMYVSGPVVVTFALAGMSYSTYLGFTVVLPLLAPTHSAAWFAYGVSCAMLYANCVFNYLAAALINPGTSDSAAFKQLVQEALHTGALTTEAVDNPSTLASPELEAEYGRGAWVMQPPYAWSYCSRTLHLKPPRAHYCSFSKDLVLNLDHYCIWVANTIGWSNYRYFLLWLWYFFLGVVFAISCTLPLYLERLPELDARFAVSHTLDLLSPSGV
jgi:hypothetical protein